MNGVQDGCGKIDGLPDVRIALPEWSSGGLRSFSVDLQNNWVRMLATDPCCVVEAGSEMHQSSFDTFQATLNNLRRQLFGSAVIQHLWW